MALSHPYYEAPCLTCWKIGQFDKSQK